MLTPIKRDAAFAFIGKYHRHNKPPIGCVCQVAVSRGGIVVGVAVAGRPVARELDDGMTLEITRVCTGGERNACSMLYGALCRAASALGYRRVVTYTLVSESGASLKASGFTLDAELKPRPTWSCPARARYQVDLFGDEQRPSEAKRRWVRWLSQKS